MFSSMNRVTGTLGLFTFEYFTYSYAQTISKSTGFKLDQFLAVDSKTA